MPDGVHNGSLIQGAKRSQIIELLAQGESANFIAKRLHHSRNTIHAIRDEEWSRVEQRKARLAAQSELIATRAAEHLLDALHTRKIKGAALVPVYGVAIDKMLALRGETSLTIRHDHFHQITDDDIIAFAVARSKPAQAKQAQIIDSQIVSESESATETRLQAKKTQSKKKVL